MVASSCMLSSHHFQAVPYYRICKQQFIFKQCQRLLVRNYSHNACVTSYAEIIAFVLKCLYGIGILLLNSKMSMDFGDVPLCLSISNIKTICVEHIIIFVEIRRFKE